MRLYNWEIGWEGASDFFSHLASLSRALHLFTLIGLLVFLRFLKLAPTLVRLEDFIELFNNGANEIYIPVTEKESPQIGYRKQSSLLCIYNIVISGQQGKRSVHLEKKTAIIFVHFYSLLSRVQMGLGALVPTSSSHYSLIFTILFKITPLVRVSFEGIKNVFGTR